MTDEVVLTLYELKQKHQAVLKRLARLEAATERVMQLGSVQFDGPSAIVTCPRPAWTQLWEALDAG